MCVEVGLNAMDPRLIHIITHSYLLNPYTHTLNPCATAFPGGLHPYIAIHSYFIKSIHPHSEPHCVLYSHLWVKIFFSEDWNSDYKKGCIELTNFTTVHSPTLRVSAPIRVSMYIQYLLVHVHTYVCGSMFIRVQCIFA